MLISNAFAQIKSHDQIFRLIGSSNCFHVIQSWGRNRIFRLSTQLPQTPVIMIPSVSCLCLVAYISSETLPSPSIAILRCPLPSIAILCHPLPSFAVLHHPSPSFVIFREPSPSFAILCHRSLSFAIPRHPSPSLAILCHLSPSFIFYRKPYPAGRGGWRCSGCTVCLFTPALYFFIYFEAVQLL